LSGVGVGNSVWSRVRESEPNRRLLGMPPHRVTTFFGGYPMRYFRLSSAGLAGSAAFLLASLSAPSAHAQSAAAAPGADSGGLEEVIVTAEKRTENVQKTPIAITTIPGAEISERAENDLQTALRDVPSLQIEGTAQGGAVYLRGVGTNGDSNFVDPAVAVNIDGVYTGRSESLSTGLFDINRIEVLKGPQGTLVGRNADAGSINIISNNPVIGSSETDVNLQYGNFSLVHGDFAQNVPLGDKLAVRVAGMVENRDGYFTNDGYSSHVQALRVKVLAEPTSDWSILGLFLITHQDGDLATTVAAPPTPFLGPPTPPFADQCAGPAPRGGWLDAQPSNPWYVDPCHPADRIDYRFVTGALQSDWTQSWGTVTVIPTYTFSRRYVLTNLVVGDDPFFGGALSPGLDEEDQKNFEFRVTSPISSPIKWVIGYYYLWSNNGGTFGGTQANNFSFTPTGATAPITADLFNTISAGQSPTTSSAPYAQVTYPLTNTFRLTGGLRYTQDKKSQASELVSVYYPGYDSGNTVDRVAYSATTYDVGFEYDLAPQSMLYAKDSTGYKAGGFDTTATPPKSYGPEHVDAYEVGIKNQFLDNTLRLNADVYYYLYTDLQAQYSLNVLLPIPVANQPPLAGTNGALLTAFQQYVANAGRGTNKGAELELQYRFTPHDELDFSGTYTDARYGDFSPTLYPQLVDLDDARMAATPVHTEWGSYQHDWDLQGGKLTAQIDSKLSSYYWSSVNNRTNWYSYQAPYHRSDASLVFASDKKWKGSLWIKNIENEAQLGFGDFPLNRRFITDPRTYGVNYSLIF
jgi:iron complex outermembrane recepter protein